MAAALPSAPGYSELEDENVGLKDAVRMLQMFLVDASCVWEIACGRCKYHMIDKEAEMGPGMLAASEMDMPALQESADLFWRHQSQLPPGGSRRRYVDPYASK